MKTWLASISMLLLLSATGFAEEVNPITGLFFNTVSHGERLIITTRVPNHPQLYPQAGIQILTPGFVLTDPASECSSYNARTRMCIFPVGNTEPKVISIKSTAQASDIANVKLCLDGVGQLTCQHYTHRGNQRLTTQRAYVVSSSQNLQKQGYVSVCELLNNGATFGVCLESAKSASSKLVSPRAITFNARGDMAYVTDFGNGAVANCVLDPATGLFSACHSNPTGIPTPSSNPPGRSILGAVAVSAGYVYVPYFDANSLQIWSLKASGQFNTMTPFPDPSFSGPNSATLSPSGNWVYVANLGTYNPGTQQYSGNTISFCGVNGSSLSVCNSYNDALFKGPLSVSFNSLGDRIYVANVNDSTVTVCNVDPITGVISSCVDSTGTFNFDASTPISSSNIFMQSGLNYGYVPNAVSDTVSICQFNGGNGAFTGCTTSASHQFLTPTGVALNPSVGS